jgi:hypothetical protein
VILFVDEGMGRYVVPNAIREAGVRAEAHLDHFAQGTPDADWIGDVSRRGWVIVGKDKGHRFEPLEMRAIETSGARLFTLAGGMRTGAENAVAIVKALRAMERFDVQHAPPYIARITRAGRVEKIYAPNPR